ncbi:Enkurin [Clonorchis sinensis]|uniref:Enkurin n=1 Tax=Clonorchis sinensis TaxID=79923 RepID=A0A8T1M138_CLOSI|nr:Enkurin [Clonorchis sinensis]
MEESIYNLLPKPLEIPPKPLRYTSQFRHTVEREFKSDKHKWKTMGPAKVPVPTPDNFLKKNEGQHMLHMPRSKSASADDRKTFRDCLLSTKKADLPSKSNKVFPHLPCATDYVTMNRIAAQKMPSKKAKRLLVDTRTGDKIDLPPSGLELVYVYKKKFGDVPDYLVQRAKAVALAKQQYSDYVKEMKRREALYQVSEEEKKSLLNGLKGQWDALYQQYQCLPVMMDTLTKINRKQWLEAALSDLEQDIEMLEGHQDIYVAN